MGLLLQAVILVPNVSGEVCKILIRVTVHGLLPSPFDSIRDAVFTVSPNKQYLGILRPTTPATTEPGVQQNNE